MQTLKSIFFLFPLMVIGSFKAGADLPLPMTTCESNWLSFLADLNHLKAEFSLTSSGILFDLFFLWAAYIVFCFSRNKLKKQ